MVDHKLFEQWDSKNFDEWYYQFLKDLVSKDMVSKDMEDRKPISKTTFEVLLEWKTNGRSNHWVNWENYKAYLEMFKEVLSLPQEERIKRIISSNKLNKELGGIGVRVGSTILHFLDPEEFPIIDYRVVKTLQDNGRINKSEDAKSFCNTIGGYKQYRSIILDLARKYGKSVREIEYTLFQEHKKNEILGNYEKKE